MNRGRADVPPPGPPRDLPHGRTASPRVQIVKPGKEIGYRTWRRRLTPDCWHLRIDLLRPQLCPSSSRLVHGGLTGPRFPHDSVSPKGYAKMSTAVKACVRIAISCARSVILERKASTLSAQGEGMGRSRTVRRWHTAAGTKVLTGSEGSRALGQNRRSRAAWLGRARKGRLS